MLIIIYVVPKFIEASYSNKWKIGKIENLQESCTLEWLNYCYF